MNFRDIIFLDFETTSPNPHTCQPIQFACVCIDGRKLEIREDSLFKSYIRPVIGKEKCEKLNLDEMNDEITKITGITLDDIKGAPSPETFWENFKQYHRKFNPTGNKWSAPIKSGYNIDNFDSVIIDRLAGGHNRQAKKQIEYFAKAGIIDASKNKVPEPYGFGPWDDKRQEETLFYPRDCIDLMRIVWCWTENLEEIKSLSFDSVREWLGISKDGAHTADKDVLDGANVLIRFLKFQREIANTTNWRKNVKV